MFRQPSTGLASRRQGARSHRAHLAVVGIAVSAVVLLVMMLHAATAQAKIPIVGEIPVIGEIDEGILGVGEAVLNPAEAVLKGFVHLLQAIFGGFEAHLITEVIGGLLSIPNFDTGHVAELEHTTTAIAAGMLSAVLTLSIVRYYIAGLSNSASGGFEALQGLVRTVGAVGLIILWPGFFTECLEIPNAFNHALLGSTSVQHNVALLFDAALAIGSGAFAINIGLGLIFVILIGLISAVVFIGLLWMKVLLSVMMMFLYVSMPLCIVLWPVPELSWFATSAMKALGVATVVPSVWAILFSLSSAVNADVLTFAGSHSIVDTVIIRPLAGITLMLLCITIPRFLMRTALIGPHGQPGGWRVWRTVTFGMFAARAAAGGARSVASAATEGHPGASRVINALPSQIKPPTEAGSGSLAGRMVFGRSGYSKDQEDDGDKVPAPDLAAPDRSGASSANATGSGAATTAGQSGAQQPAASAAGAAGEQPAEPVRQQPAGAQAQAGQRQDRAARDARRQEVDAAGEGMHRQAYSGDRSSASEVHAAMGRLAPETQQRLGEIRDTNPRRLRDSIANAIPSPGWTDEERQALWTIGAARMREAGQGIDSALAGTSPPVSEQPSSGTAAGASSPRVSPSSPGGGAAGGAAPATPTGAAGGEAPPSGSPSLGAPIREQPPTGDLLGEDSGVGDEIRFRDE